MKVKLSKLQNSQNSINVLANTRLNFKTSYDVAKRLGAIVSELELFEKIRIEKLKELSGDLIENNEYILGDNRAKFEIELKELLDQEVDLNIHPLKYEDLVKLDIFIEPSHLLNLNFLISEPVVISTHDCSEEESKI